MSDGLPILDLCVLAAYLLGVVGLGCALARKSGSTEEFMAAGRSLPGWVVGMSIFGTYVSSISFLANPGKSYAANWNPFVFSLSLPLAAWVAARHFVPFFRRSGKISCYEHLEDRFGTWARTYAVVCFLLTQLARVATILYLVALALSPLLNVSIWVIIVVTGIMVTLYTMLGGIEAVIWTDVVQSVVLTLGMLLTVGVIVWSMPGGVDQLFQIAVRDRKFSLGSFGASVSDSTFWVVLVYGACINLQNFAVDQTYVQRYATARSEADARRSVWLGAMLYLPISALLFFVGTGLYAFYQAQPAFLPTQTGEPVIADAMFPHFIATQLPAGAFGLLIAAILAAAMSSVDSSLNCSATVILSDIYKRHVRSHASERESMRFLHWATLVCGLIGTGAALGMIGAQSVLDLWWHLAGIAGGGLLGLFVLGRLSPRIRGTHAGVAMVTGVAVILWATFSPMTLWPGALDYFRSPFAGILTIVLGTFAILAAGVTAALLFPMSREGQLDVDRSQG